MSPIAFVVGLFGLTLLSGLVLTSSTVSAEYIGDTYADDVAISVPIACTMNGVGMNTHNAEIPNGTYRTDIGTTTLKAYCNDADGFAIYAIGYTNDTDGKNVLTNSTLGSTYDIMTGTNTGPVGGNDTSNWAMKLTPVTNPAPTYPITIQSDNEGSFSNYHTVPNDYTLVAKRTAGTDVGQNAEGSSLTTTYSAYIKGTQPAGTYTGQVKYVLLHPNYADKTALEDAITVVFDGNGLTFPNGQTTNTVKYANVCKPGEYAYVANTPVQIVRTSNINNDGTQNGPYGRYNTTVPITVTGANKMKVVVDYGISDNENSWITIVEGEWGGDTPPEGNYNIIGSETNKQGQESFIYDGDTVSIQVNTNGAPVSGYDYGFYTRIYPVYNTQQPDTTSEQLPGDCSIMSVVGGYMETNPWKGGWTITIDGYDYEITSEEDLIDLLSSDYDTFKEANVSANARNPYTLVYNGNGASGEFGMGTQTYFSRDWGQLPLELSEGDDVTLLASNYKRAGYGFIGWSTDANAASHLNTVILYGPSETVIVDQTLLNAANNDHEITLYAIWLASAGNIQNWNGCSSMSIGDTTALTDTRDNDTYAVAKLVDGNCWMIENLRLGGNSPITLTTANTQSAGVLPAITTSWGANNESQNLDIENTVSPPTVVDYGLNVRKYSYGNYYSWATAINSTNAINSGNATTSICPAGWQLPSSTIYNGLNNEISDTSSDFRSYPNNFVYAGMRDNGSYESWKNMLNYGGGMRILFANYWTSSSGTYANYATRLSLESDSDFASIGSLIISHAGGQPYKYNGYSVRCVLPVSN